MKVCVFYIVNNVTDNLNCKKQLSVTLELLRSKIHNCQIKMHGYRELSICFSFWRIRIQLSPGSNSGEHLNLRNTQNAANFWYSVSTGVTSWDVAAVRCKNVCIGTATEQPWGAHAVITNRSGFKLVSKGKKSKIYWKQCCDENKKQWMVVKIYSKLTFV